MLVFGHRGAPGFPRHGENTIQSFNKALGAGADGIEFDIRRCGDGRIVIIHDETIDRTTNGKGRVSELSYDQLKTFDAGAGDRIPLLSDVLDQFGKRCVLNIEIKEPGLGSDLKDLVRAKGLEANVIVSAFDWLELESLSGSLPIALLASEPRDLIVRALDMGAVAIHPRRDIARPLLEPARRANLRVHVWTVNEPAEIAGFRDLNVDAIFSDFPERCTTPAS